MIHPLRRYSVVLLALSLAAPLLVAFSSSASAFDTVSKSHRWPHGQIHYFVKNKAIVGDVTAAARLWNRSGAKVRFTRVHSKKHAGLVVFVERFGACQNGRLQPGASAERLADANLGYGFGRKQQLRFDNTCPTAGAINVLVHELGHVLGLNHSKKCAAMYPIDGGGCGAGPLLWEDFCQRLRPDDVRGAVHLYGGKSHVRRLSHAYCTDKATRAAIPYAPRITSAVAYPPSTSLSLLVSFAPGAGPLASTGFGFAPSCSMWPVSPHGSSILGRFGVNWRNPTGGANVPAGATTAGFYGGIAPGNYCLQGYSFAANNRYTEPAQTTIGMPNDSGLAAQLGVSARSFYPVPRGRPAVHLTFSADAATMSSFRFASWIQGACPADPIAAIPSSYNVTSPAPWYRTSGLGVAIDDTTPNPRGGLTCYLIAFDNTSRVAEIPVNVPSYTAGSARRIRPQELHGTVLEQPSAKHLVLPTSGVD